MYFYFKKKNYRMWIVVFIVLCVLSTNLIPPLSASASDFQAIMGEAITEKEKMVEYYNENSPIPYPQEYLDQGISLDKFVDIIIQEAELEGVRADVAFAQILVETDWLAFDDEVSLGQNNLGNLKEQDGNYLFFDSVEEGIRANIQLLKGYASDAPLNQKKIVSLYDSINPKGMITHVESLGNGNWSKVPEYGENIEQYLEEIINIKFLQSEETEPEIPQETGSETPEETEFEINEVAIAKPYELPEVKTLTIDGPGYVGESHRIRSLGTSVNGVLYQFWIKDLSTNQWTMIQDYSKSGAPWTPIKPGKYLYGVHIKDEKSTAKLDAHLYKEITIEERPAEEIPVEINTLTIDGPGYVGESHRIRSSGKSVNGVLYQFWIKDLSTNQWTMIQDYSKSGAPWTPTKSGKYLYGVHIKDEKSTEKLDAHLYKEITIEEKSTEEIPVEINTLIIEGSGYVGESHRIRSSGISVNGVLYQFWIKNLSTNQWTMIQDYSKSGAPWTPTKSGKYLYGVHIKDEKSTEKLDAHLYKEITIEEKPTGEIPVEINTLTIEGSGYVGESHRIRSSGTSVNGVLYQFWIKDLSTNQWTMIQDYSKSSALWTPTKPGKYLYGVHIKDEKSNNRLDAHLYEHINIENNIVGEALNSYKELGIDYWARLQEYDVLGDYLNYGKTKRYAESANITLDDDGIPKVRYGEEFFYNPVTIAQYSLMKYGQYLDNKEEINKLEFLTAVDKLIETQDEIGAFRFEFPWRYYLTGEIFKPGWVSGLAQGQALNALSRAYYLSEDTKYLEAGNKALEFMITKVEEGGTKSTLEDLDSSFKDYIFFEEYISTPNNYTLNGYMFTLLGLYDWKIITNKYQPEMENLAEENFESGIRTLEVILPYYDIGGFSAYNLGHLTFDREPHIGVSYHAVHITLLHALDSIENNETLKKFEELWRSYVDDL